MPVFVEIVFEFLKPPSWKALGCGKQYLFWNPDKLLFWICSSDVSELICKWGAMCLNITIEKRLQVRLRDWLTILATVVATNVEKSRNAGNLEYFPSYSYYYLKEYCKMNLLSFCLLGTWLQIAFFNSSFILLAKRANQWCLFNPFMNVMILYTSTITPFCHLFLWLSCPILYPYPLLLSTYESVPDSHKRCGDSTLFLVILMNQMNHGIM